MCCRLQATPSSQTGVGMGHMGAHQQSSLTASHHITPTSRTATSPSMALTDLIIETGTANGGSALLWASVLENSELHSTRCGRYRGPGSHTGVPQHATTCSEG